MKTMFYVLVRVFIGLIAVVVFPFAFVFFFSDGVFIKLSIVGFYLAVFTSFFLIERYAGMRWKRIMNIANDKKGENFSPCVEIESAFSNRYIGIDNRRHEILYIDDDLKKSEVLKGSSVLKWEIEREGRYPLVTIYLNNKDVPFLKIRIHKKNQDKYVSYFRNIFA